MREVLWSAALVVFLVFIVWLSMAVAAVRAEQKRAFGVITRLQEECMNLRDELSVTTLPRRDPAPFRHKKAVFAAGKSPDDPGPRRDLPNIYEDWPQ
jgi:hypothetical protein